MQNFITAERALVAQVLNATRLEMREPLSARAEMLGSYATIKKAFLNLYDVKQK